MNTINCLWIGTEISIMELLSIKMAQKLGFDVTLWSNSTFSNLPDNVVCKRIPDNFVPPTPFNGIPLTCIPNGGIGSLSHWSDYVAFNILKDVGGYWMQLDFVLLERPDTDKDYIFTPFGDNGVSPVFMKLPANSLYVKEVAECLENKIKDGFANQHWFASMSIMNELALKHNVCEKALLLKEGYHDCGGFYGNSAYTTQPQQYVSCVHWSNATHHASKTSPIEGSLYYDLCKQNDLI